MKRWIVAGLAAGVSLLMARQFPDIRRYIKIKMM